MQLFAVMVVVTILTSKKSCFGKIYLELIDTECVNDEKSYKGDSNLKLHLKPLVGVISVTICQRK